MAINSLAAAVCFYGNAWGGAPRGRVELTTARDGMGGGDAAVAIRSSGSDHPGLATADWLRSLLWYL